jgi:hypothetical protein
VERAAKRENKKKSKEKSGRPSLTPLQEHQIERVDAVIKLAYKRAIPRFGVESAAVEALGITEDQLSHYRRKIVKNTLFNFILEYAKILPDGSGRENWARDIISDAGRLFKLSSRNT